MRNYHEMTAFCQGYLEGALACNATLSDWDDWVIWGGYDINFAGIEYSSLAETDKGLRVDAYNAQWVDNIGEPIHSFTIKGESK